MNVFALQAQYIFVHDALLEAVICGDTEITVKDLARQIKSLQQVNPESGKTLLHEEFEVPFVSRLFSFLIHFYFDVRPTSIHELLGSDMSARIKIKHFRGLFLNPQLRNVSSRPCESSLSKASLAKRYLMICRDFVFRGPIRYLGLIGSYQGLSHIVDCLTHLLID